MVNNSSGTNTSGNLYETSLTTGGLLYATTGGVLSSSAALTGIVTGNGTSAPTANAITQHGVVIGGASNAASSLGVASTGTVLAGTTGADPAFTATPSVTSITLSSGTALANYLETTFTPTVIGTTGAGTANYTTQTGVYTRIGRQIFFYIDLAWNTGTGTGNLRLGGLPVTVNSGFVYPTGVIQYGTAIATASTLLLFPNASAVTADLFYQVETAGSTAAAPYPASSFIRVSGTYFV